MFPAIKFVWKLNSVRCIGQYRLQVAYDVFWPPSQSNRLMVENFHWGHEWGQLQQKNTPEKLHRSRYGASLIPSGHQIFIATGFIIIDKVYLIHRALALHPATSIASWHPSVNFCNSPLNSGFVAPLSSARARETFILEKIVTYARLLSRKCHVWCTFARRSSALAGYDVTY